MVRYIKYSSGIRNPRSKEYDQYLIDHIEGVNKSWNTILRSKIKLDWLTSKNILLGDFLSNVDSMISNHDESKYDDEEYSAYCNYFYPSAGFEKDEAAFDAAWLHHIHCNPHHPQYYILHEDSGTEKILDMPLEYICEMLCDWSSFQYTRPGSTANKWYTANKDKMMFSESTRKLVETILKDCEKL